MHRISSRLTCGLQKGRLNDDNCVIVGEQGPGLTELRQILGKMAGADFFRFKVELLKSEVLRPMWPPSSLKGRM